MGGTQSLMEDIQEKRCVAIEVAVECGALGRCKLHDIVYAGNGDFTAAYRLGNAKFSRGAFEGVFVTTREMTDTIKEVIENNSGEECSFCAKLQNED
jgi:hypothetical protein